MALLDSIEVRHVLDGTVPRERIETFIKAGSARIEFVHANRPPASECRGSRVGVARTLLLEINNEAIVFVGRVARVPNL